MAVKIVRQPNKISVFGVPTSAAALSSGHEGAPSALRAAGLIDRLRLVGYEVTDLGDDPEQVYRSDEESPRARNLPGVLAVLESVKPRIEQAVKSNSLPVILSGDRSVALATIAGMRRYFRNLSLIYMDRDADLHTPANTTTGSVDGMVVSHLTGRGAAELVRFWAEPPLVREPDLALFGLERIDQPEEDALRQFPIRVFRAADILKKGAAKSAQEAIDRIHGGIRPFLLHLDVDVISDFQATDFPGTDGLGLPEVHEALAVFATQSHLAGIELAAYNPAKDVDGSGARLLVDLLAETLRARLTALHPDSGDGPPSILARGPLTEPATALTEGVHPGATASTSQAWSSAAIENDPAMREGIANSSETSGSSDEIDS